MDSHPVPKFDFSTMPPEDLSDFISLPWYQTLLSDASFTPIGNRNRRDNDPETRRRTFFSETLWTDSTVRASQTFYKGFIPPERWSGEPRSVEAQSGPGECRIVYSLGDALSGGGPNAHGGLMATLLDETLGTPLFVQWAAGCATAELSMKYERPLPVPAVVLCRSWTEKAEGRKVWIQGVIEDGNGLVFVRARSLFIKFRERL